MRGGGCGAKVGATVLERASIARYLPTGHLVFGREGFLFAVPFDIDSLAVLGQAVPVLENVMGMRSSGVVHIDFARNGLMAYIAGSPRSRHSRLFSRSRSGCARARERSIGVRGRRLKCALPSRPRHSRSVCQGSSRPQR